jgi:PKD repeat protein
LNHAASNYQTTETVTILQVATVAAAIVADNTTVNGGDMVTVDISNTTGATNTTIDMGDGTVYNNEAIVNHVYTTGGTYTVTLNANNDNCSDAASLQIRVEDLTTSIADTDTKGIKVYANANELYIEQLLEKGDIKAKVDVYNMLGQIVTSVDITATYQVPSTIILTDVAKGTYIAQVTANKKTVSKRIVVSE